MKLNHTLGPWHVDSQDDGFVMSGYGNAEVLVATRANQGEPVENLANALLIAAAPDMLLALQKALECLEGIAPHREEYRWFQNIAGYARAAIAKATGATED